MSEAERDPIAEEEAEAAAAEAARIGGPAPDDPAGGPAERPLVEGGEGQAEGFELAERELIDNAEHGNQRHFPDTDVPEPEEATEAAFGEADRILPAEEGVVDPDVDGADTEA